MAAISPPICDFGWRPSGFTLSDPSGKHFTLDDIRGEQATLIMFICNHCPYVRSVIDRIVGDAKALASQGVGIAAIMSNDWHAYPDDAPERMAEFASENGFDFPYLIDQDQSVARTWDAVCTPDFFGFNKALELQYRGRLDASRAAPAAPGARRDLYEAMMEVVRTGQGPIEQIASMGCSIKWRDAA